MKNISERIVALRARKGYSQQELANKLGVALRSVQNWEGGEANPRGKALRSLSEVLGTTIPFLLGDPEGPNVNLGGRSASFALRKVPVISWTKAGEGGNYYDVEHYLQEEVTTDCADASAYALIVEDDSMEPKFFPGDRVIVAPGDEPINGDIVVARLEETGQVFLKLYHVSGKNNSVVRLTSYNPVYPPLEFARKDFRFIHPVHSMSRNVRARR